MQLTYIFALLFSVVIAMFAIVNAQPVKVDFVFDEFQISLALIILISAFAGAFILGFLGLFKQIKSGFQLRDVKGKNKKLEAQIEEVDKKLIDVQTSLQDKESSIKELDENLAAKQNLIEELEDRLVDKEKTISHLKEKLGVQADHRDGGGEESGDN